MYIPPIGAKIRMNDNRVELPFWLGSMDKLKPEDVLQLKRWLVKNESKDYNINKTRLFQHTQINYGCVETVQVAGKQDER